MTKVNSLIGVFLLLPFLVWCQAQNISKQGLGRNRSGFFENKGQITAQDGKPNPEVLYLHHSPCLNVQLKLDGFAYDTYHIEKEGEATIEEPNGPESFAAAYHRLDVSFVGANPQLQVIAQGKSSDYLNFYKEFLTGNGATFVHHYQRVVYKNIYPNIDVAFFLPQNGSPVEYNFIVHPGGDPNLIKLRYEGAPVSLCENGTTLEFQLRQGLMQETVPASWYARDGKKEKVDVRYVQLDENTFGFSGGENLCLKSSEHLLVIDPTPALLWGTYYGTNALDRGEDVATDANDNVYLAGRTASTTNIATSGAHQTVLNGATDAFVAKFNSNGVRQWGTYYGGSADEEFFGVAFGSDHVHLFGHTTSDNSGNAIATAGAHQTSPQGSDESFLVKLNGSGVRVWGTYYSGTVQEQAEDIAVDGSGNIYIAGSTNSPNTGNVIATTHQTTFGGGLFDAFLAKFNSNGVRQWGTYYGGTGEDKGEGVSVDGSGNVFLSGRTKSTGANVIATSGAHQTTLNSAAGNAFMVKFNSSGVRQWGTYYGGTNITLGYGNATDGNGNVFMAGQTSANDNIATEGTHQTTRGGGADAYIVKFNGSGVRQWGTYYGGTVSDQGYAVATDASGDVYIVGETASSNAIHTSGSHQESHGGGIKDVFISKFIGSSGLQGWGTYYGGTGEDFGYSIANVSTDTVMVTGYTTTSLGIATAGAHQYNYGGNDETFLAEFGNGEGGALLPVELLYFDAHADGKTVRCHWATASEKNSDYFLVERSRDGRVFEQIGKVGAAGNSSTGKEYSFDDEKPFEGSSYYRLKQVDFDGTTGYSKIVVVQLDEAEPEFTFFPNPVQARLTIEATKPVEKLEIFDLEGQMVVGLSSGDFPEQIDLGSLSPGIYLLKAEVAGSLFISRLVKE